MLIFINASKRYQKLALCLLGASCLAFGFSSTFAATPGNTTWEPLQTGLAHIKLTKTEAPVLNTGHLDGFKIDLKNFDLQLVTTEDVNQENTSVRTLARSVQGILAINGGFFTPEFKLIGLRIQNGNRLSPLSSTSWWGVFYIKDDQAYITSQSRFREKDKAIRTAVQSGPRLLVNGKIPKLKPGSAERSGVCITDDNHVVLAATTNAPLSTTDFAKLLKTFFSCRQALNLDGGQSTQLYARLPRFYLYTRYFSNIIDALVAIPKTS